jgi:N-acetyl-alpha-D-glucosaminyl L-malate synthase BshA
VNGPVQSAADDGPATVPPAATDRPMVIAQVCHGAMGGSSRVACRLAGALARRGHRVLLLSRVPVPWTLDARVARQELRPAGGPSADPLYWDWVADDLLAFGDLLAATLTAQRVDILHYHYAQPFAGIVRRLARALGDRMPATIGTLHGTDLTRCLPEPHALSRIGRDLAATDALTTVSQHMGTLAAAIPGIGAQPHVQPHVLPNFIDDDWPGFADAPPPPTRPALLHVSNFRAVKDVGLLAKLFVAVHERIDAELWLVGDGPEMPALKRLLDGSSAAAAVRYWGVCAAPAGYFRAATICLSTSLEESFGLAVLEAMASGVPVVATAVGGIPELVQDDVTGLLFDPGDLDRTVARIVTLLGSPERLAALGQAARVYADRMRESRMMPLYENLYRDTLNRRIGARAV